MTSPTSQWLGLSLACCYALLLLLSTIQLSKIVYFQHSLSFQSAFLSLAMLYTGLRLAFFAQLVSMPAVVSFILDNLSLDCQLAIFLLLLIFYSSLITHPNWRLSNVRKIYLFLFLSICFILPVFTTAVSIAIINISSVTVAVALIQGRLALTALLLLVVAVGFVDHGRKLHRKRQCEALASMLKHVPFPVTLLTVLCLIVLVSRAVVRLLSALRVIDFDVSDRHGDVSVDLLSFFALIGWEVVPTAMIHAFFHEIPATNYRDTDHDRKSFACCRSSRRVRRKTLLLDGVDSEDLLRSDSNVSDIVSRQSHSGSNDDGDNAPTHLFISQSFTTQPSAVNGTSNLSQSLTRAQSNPGLDDGNHSYHRRAITPRMSYTKPNILLHHHESDVSIVTAPVMTDSDAYWQTLRLTSQPQTQFLPLVSASNLSSKSPQSTSTVDTESLGSIDDFVPTRLAALQFLRQPLAMGGSDSGDGSESYFTADGRREDSFTYVPSMDD